MAQKQNIEWMDTMRALATLSVIIVHVVTPVVKMSYGVDMDSWWVGNFIDSALRCCVPLFLLLSGATLLSKDYKLMDFYKKRFMRVLLPFLFWAIIYWVYSCLIIRQGQRPYGVEAIVNWAIKLFVDKGISTHFWFIYMLLVLYLFIPLLGRGLRRINERTILYILLIWFVFNSLYIFKVIVLTDYPVIKKIVFYLQYAGYLVMGYYLVRKDFSKRTYKIWGVILFVGSVLFVAFHTYYVSKAANELKLYTYGYISPSTIIQTLAVYMMLVGTEIKNKPLAFVRNTISEYSFGIYLVHIIIIGVLFLNNIYWAIAPPLISVPLITVFVLIVSYGIIYLLRKVPGGKYISG